MSINDLKESLLSAGKYVTENASIATSKASAKLTLKQKQDALEKEYAKIGKNYFSSLSKKEKNNYKEILELEEEIKKIEANINDLNDARVCQKCGAKVSNDITYCPECGNKLK